MDRKNGYWWSLDSRFIAFTQVDSSDIPLFRIMHQGKSSVGPDAQEDHAYPFTGQANVNVRLGVISATGGLVTWMDISCGGNHQQISDEEYLARVHWLHGNSLCVQVLNRRQTELKILKFDITTGERETLLVERNEKWVNLHDCFTPLDKRVSNFEGGFIWASEKSGYKHLYLHDSSGKCISPITEGEWMVEHICGVNEAAGLIYFTGTLDGPLESHLYHTKLFRDGDLPIEPPCRLTEGKGKHMVVLDHRFQFFADIYDSLNSPPIILLRDLATGDLVTPLYEQPLTTPRFKKLHLEPPVMIQIQASDGTALYGSLYKPDEAKYGPPPYKTLLSVYGGPGVQLVSDSWIGTVDMRAQYLRSNGVLVCKVHLYYLPSIIFLLALFDFLLSKKTWLQTLNLDFFLLV